MFIFVLIACVIGAAVHSMRLPERSPQRIGELFLLYVLIGYCGISMLVVSIGIIAAPDYMATVLPIGDASPVVAFFGWAYLGMSLLPILALRYRGTFLIAPAVCWGVYFAGATVVHLHGEAGSGHLSHGGVLLTFATHGLVSIVLGVALVSSGLLNQTSSSGPAAHAQT